MKILVTGANGFVGNTLCSFLKRTTSHSLIRTVRNPTNHEDLLVGDINEKTDWSLALAAAPDIAVHTAGHVHITDKAENNNLDRYRSVNTLGSINFAKQCAKAGVRRFVFISTIKVLGEGKVSQPYSADDLALPQDSYSQSKWDAEQGLKEIAAQTGMQLTILRPPLVYGPNVKANFFNLMRAVDYGFPLPFGAINNRRSLIYIENLAHAITTCIDHPSANGKTYLVSDGTDVSTPELIELMCTALKRPNRLVAVPPSWLYAAGKIMRKGQSVERLLGSLYVDSRPIQEELGWSPPYSLEAGLAVTADWYQSKRKKHHSE